MYVSVFETAVLPRLEVTYGVNLRKNHNASSPTL
jgi:hypothetical protein